MRLLLINPNTSEDVTRLVATEARRLAGAGTELIAATGRFGARYVASRAAYAIAAHAALDLLAIHADSCDAVLLACFGDPGLAALREVSRVPVVGLAEASCREAARQGRFAIVTGGERWEPMLREFVAAIGLSDRLAGIRTVAPDGAAIAADPEGAVDLLARACEACFAEDGADVVILGGAGLAGLADIVAPRLRGPVICSLAAGMRAALAAAQDRGPQTSAEPPRMGTVGLSGELARMLDGAARR